MIEALNLNENKFLTHLKSLGCKKLVVQKGDGEIQICAAFKKRAAEYGISLNIFHYTADLCSILKSSDLIICHGGSGTIFEEK